MLVDSHAVRSARHSDILHDRIKAAAAAVVKRHGIGALDEGSVDQQTERARPAVGSAPVAPDPWLSLLYGPVGGSMGQLDIHLRRCRGTGLTGMHSGLPRHVLAERRPDVDERTAVDLLRCHTAP